MTTTTAREYLRVSKDKSGRERSITEQHAENAAEATAHGWTLGDPYSDVGSASRYATKARGDYNTLIADLQADRFGADVLILWESSRGSRKASECIALIELCEERGVKIHVTTHGRTYDPGNARDRKTLRDDASDSEWESDKLSKRATRANGADAEAGRPHGRVPYGYRRVYDPTTGKLAAQEIEPDEAKIVRELFDRIVNGHSLKSIAADLARRGVSKRSGGPFSAAHLRSMATQHAYGEHPDAPGKGIRVHAPGRKDGNLQSVGFTIHKAGWPAIVPRRTWLAVQAIVTAPERRTNRPGRAKHLLSMIARCDVCSGPLAVTFRGGRGPEYQCHEAGHVRVSKADLDDLAERVIVGYLTRRDHARKLTRPDDGVELQAARDAVAEIRAELDDLADQVGRGELSAGLAARAEPVIRERLKAVERRRDEMETPNVLRGLIKPGADVRRRWDAADVAVRRQIARLLLSPDYLGELRITRSATPGHRCPVQDRVVWRTEKGISGRLVAPL